MMVERCAGNGRAVDRYVLIGPLESDSGDVPLTVEI